MTHAFFKALLFLGAGVVILSLHEEHNMFKMGGLRRQLPLTFWTFLIGAVSLSALPLVTAGFYSKDLILWQAYSSQSGSTWLWAAGLIGALLTSIYTFRMVFLTFFGPPSALVQESAPLPRPGPRVHIPLIVLAVLSVVGGLVELPETLGGRPLFSDFLQAVLPAVISVPGRLGSEFTLQVVAGGVSLAGIGLACGLFLANRQWAARLVRTAWGGLLQRFWFAGWGFDWLYDRLFVRPVVWFAQANQRDYIDLIYFGLAGLGRALNRTLSGTETGKVRWYATGIAMGAIIIIAIAVIV
jgi:NADH-quinone oxidoreductase subunit L